MSNRDRSPTEKRGQRPKDGPSRRGRSRSRSPRFSGRDWKLGGVSNNTQRDEEHLKRARIFVGNIDAHTVTRADLISVFSKHGEVVAVSIHPGYSFIQMDSERSANRAINYEHGASINGKKINVEFSTAALKAGARFKRLPMNKSPSPSPYPPPVHPPSHGGYHGNNMDFPNDRDRRLHRILALEQELKAELDYLHTSKDQNYRMPGGLISYPDTYGSSFKRDYEGGPYPRREDMYGVGPPKSSTRPLSPRARPTTEGYSARPMAERFGSRYSNSGGGGYSDYGRGGSQGSWQ